MTFRDSTGGMVSAALNYGASSPIDVEISGGTSEQAMDLARDIRSRVAGIRGAADVRVAQRLDAPYLILNVDRQKAAAVLLLRGATPELYRPVRQALREALPHKEAIQAFAVHFRRHLTICPRDLEPAAFAQRAVRDPVTWFLSIAQFADRARVLGALLEEALLVSKGRSKLQLVHQAWQAWDRAIGGGISSDWGIG